MTSDVMIRRYRRQMILPAMLLLSLTLVAMIVQNMMAALIWDDAYLFTRYAHRLLNDGVLTWNPGESAVYGLTAPAYLLVVIPLYVLTQFQPALTLSLASVLCGAGFVLLMMSLVWRYSGAQHTLIRWLTVLLVMVSLLAAAGDLSVHFTGGMDTTFAMMMLTAFLLLLNQAEQAPRWQHNPIVAITGGLLFAVRPDIVLFPVCVILLKIVSKSDRVAGLWQLLWLAAVLMSQLLAGWLLMGTPLPLPFYVKSTAIYGEAFYTFYEGESLRFLVDYLRACSIPLLLIAISLVSQPRQWVSRLSDSDRGLILATGLFIAYHALLVTPVMGFHARFYYPAFPVILYVAARSLVLLTEYMPATVCANLRCYPFPVLLVPVIMIPAFLNPAPLLLMVTRALDAESLWRQQFMNFDPLAAYDSRYRRNWYQLDAVSSLPDDLVMATTEVGLVAALNPEKRIIDLSGLNTPQIAHFGFSADWLFQESQMPDLLYLPFPHYRNMIVEIETHPIFLRDYVYYPADMMGMNMGIAVYRQSSYASDILERLTYDNDNY